MINALTQPPSIKDARVNGLPAQRHVTNRAALCNGISGSNTQSGGRCWMISYVPITGTMRINFWNGYMLTGGGGETASGGTMTMRFSILQPNGTLTATYTSSAIASGAVGYVDIPGVVIGAYKKFFLNWDMNMGAGGHVVSMAFSNSCDRGNGDQYQVGGGGYGHTQDATYLGSGGGEVNNWLPTGVVALSNKPCLALIPDSLSEINDTVFDVAGGRGLFGRAIASSPVGIPHLNYAAPGDRASVAASGFTARAALLTANGATSALLNLGRNDFTSARTATNVIADRATIRAAIKAAGVSYVYDSTVTMNTTSTDGFNTTSAQTVASASVEIQRATFNDFIRGAAPYGITGTLTNGSPTITAVASLGLYGVFPGCVLTSTTSGIAGGTTVSSIDYTNGTITMSANFTGTTTVGAAITATQPSVTGTFPPTSSDGLIDITGLIEGGKSAALIPVRNGGVWLPGFVSPDGLHANNNGIIAARPVVDALIATRVL